MRGSNMALEAGARLGPYEIVGPAGAGGMGEVYRARDTRLDRTVAIKAPAYYQSSGSWGDDSTILFTGSDPPRICRVPAGGGRVVPVTSLDPSRGDIMHLHPRFLPGGRRFLYVVRSRTPEYTGVYIRSLDVGDHRMIVQSPGNAEYIAPGYLLFTRDAVPYAQRFDLSRLQLEGEPVPVAEHVNVNFENAGSAISAARNGSLLMYARAEAPGALKWVDGKAASATRSAPVPCTAGSNCHRTAAKRSARSAARMSERPETCGRWISPAESIRG